MLQDRHRKGKHCISSSLLNAQLGSEEALAHGETASAKTLLEDRLLAGVIYTT